MTTVFRNTEVTEVLDKSSFTGVERVSICLGVQKGIYSNNIKILTQKIIYHSIFFIATYWKLGKYPNIGDQINKSWPIYTMKYCIQL